MNRVRRGVGLGVVLAALAFAGSSSATVTRVSLTASVRAGADARLTVNVSPRARCTIRVVHAGAVVRSAGLGPKVGGRITWRWRVDATAPAGHSSVRVRCGKSGSLAAAIAVTRAPPSPTPPSGPGQKIDVGGYRLYLECTGSGSPTVVLESGFGAPGASLAPSSGWNALGPALASETRVCAYDRAGLGASDPRPRGRLGTGQTLATELAALLANAGVPAPYVFFGYSNGAYFALSHVAHWRDPAEIAGFVFGDGSNCITVCSGALIEPVELDVTGAQQLGPRPVIAVISTEPEAGAALARRSTNGFGVQAAPGVGHFVARDAPQLVAEAIRLVVTAVRSGAPLPPCAETRLPSFGGRC